MQKQGILLINLGTPSAPSALSVASYLNTFLCDGKVIDLPYILRQLLVKGIIVPFRTLKAQQAYRSIWTPRGSPLQVHMQDLQSALQTVLTGRGGSSVVALGMRYGEPSIQEGIATLRKAGCTFLHILPLYPQYAAATTGSALAIVLDSLKRTEPILPFRVYAPFYQESGFIQAFAERIQTHYTDHQLNNAQVFTLFSYHGLPERQIRKMGCQQLSQCQRQVHCLKFDHNIPNGALNCYRAQCFMTTKALIEAVGLNPTQTATAFQSRVGKIPWIKPYTDQLLLELANKKIRQIVVVCPSFIVDCLETLEEIEIRAKAQWLAKGGEHFSMVPSLNTHPTWVNALANWVSAEH